jgi:hypothetical protein
MKDLKKSIITGLLVISSLPFFAQTSVGIIKGQILTLGNEPVLGAVVKVTQGGVLVGGTSTDENGKYTYKPLNPGYYEIIVTSIETRTQRMSNIEVGPDRTTYVDMKVSTNELTEIPIEAVYVKPVVDNTMYTMKSINSDDFLHMAVNRGDIKAAIVNIASDVTESPNGDLHVRGSRGEATSFIVDGMKSPSINGVAALAVENITIITGGIPAQYGDMTSGVIVVTTKDYFGGIRAKHMRENYENEKEARIKREAAAKQEEERRKKEIEEELRLEEAAKAIKG